MDEVYSSEDDLDRLSERFESYSLSADVSESESSTGSLSRRQFASTSNLAASSSSPLQGPLFGESSVLSKRMSVNLPSLFGPRNNVVPRTEKKPESEFSEVELMKERFCKLLLGEDMSGGGKGVCTALAISNAITNLSASVFGELWKLEELAAQKKDMWRREMEWLLCVSDSIVELTPSLQEGGDGGAFEVMVPRPRSDLHVNLPALKKLDAMLISIMDGFHDSEFHYVDRGIVVSADDEDGGRSCSTRQEEKWWLPFPKLPRKGLSEETRKRLHQCRECSNQILKAAMAINGNVLAEMEVPSVYLRSLPKSGKACLGETIHRYMTADNFSPECLLDYLDLSSEYTTLEIANRIEAAVHVWKQKYTKRRLMMSKSGKAAWGGKVKGISVEKSKLLAYRAETLLQNLKLRFPGLTQTALDMSKIQFNKDVGHSILESYSRVMESLAFNVMARIDDLLYIDEDTKRQAVSGSMCLYDTARFGNALPRQNKTTKHNNFSIEQQASFASSAQPRSLHRHNQIRGSARSVKIRSSTSDTDDDDI